MTEDSKSRLRRLFGDEGLASLDSSFVVVVGLGGVGSSCAEALVRGGVGSFLFIDRDIVEPSNINRQAIAFQSTVGQRKTEVMKAMALDINPDAHVSTVHAFVTEENASDIFSAVGKPTYIIDAIDTLTAKVGLAKFAEDAGFPIISSMGMANRSDPTKLRFADLFETQGCPFSREMRKIARDRGLQKLQVLYSTEKPMKVRPTEGATRNERTELGTFSFMPPIAGQMIAGFVIKQILQPIF